MQQHKKGDDMTQKEEQKVERPKNKKELFVEEYNKLCESFGCSVVAQPTLVATNHGTFEIAIQYSVAEKQK